MPMKKFVALYDLHWGYQRVGGHKIPVHDPAALEAVKEFIEDFEPDHVVLGGDMLDTKMISHHIKGKPGQVEGFKLINDAKELSEEVTGWLEDRIPGRLVYHIGNHEDWLRDFTDENPGVEGLLDLPKLLNLSDKWEVIPVGGASKLGKLHFIHGDQLSGGEYAAKNAVVTYGTSVRFGHFHTYQAYTKNSPLSTKLPHTGIAVPCLCKKDQVYGEGKPNKWVQGFLWGYVNKDGTFSDYVSVIVDGKFIANGKEYGK